MKKVLLLTDKPFAQVAIDGIQKAVSEAGYELKLCEKYGTDLDRVKRVAADVDAMIIRSDKVNGEIMDAAPDLKIIVRAGAGYDNIDLGFLPHFLKDRCRCDHAHDDRRPKAD